MRVARRRGVAEGVIVGAAVASSARRPAYGAPVVVAAPYPAYPPTYYPPPPGPSVVYSTAPATQPSNTEIIINTNDNKPPMGYPPTTYPQYPQYPPPQQPDGYRAPPPMVQPVAPAAAVQPPPYMVQPNAPPPPSTTVVEVVKPNPAVVAPPAAVAAGIGAAAAVNAIERNRSLLIVNEANCSVLEINHGNAKPNAQVVSNKRRPDRPACQVWYIDETGVIRSKLNNFAMEAKENGSSLRMMPFTGDARQKWTFKDNKIINEVFRNDCLGLKKGIIRLKDDADVVSGPYEGKPYQHWRIEFI